MYTDYTVSSSIIQTVRAYHKYIEIMHDMRLNDCIWQFHNFTKRASPGPNISKHDKTTFCLNSFFWQMFWRVQDVWLHVLTSTHFDRFSDLELIRSTHEFQRFITVPAQGCDDQRTVAHVFALRLATSDECVDPDGWQTCIMHLSVVVIHIFACYRR